MHFLHEFWGMVGHLVNTLIFVIAGIIIVTRLVVAYDPSYFWTDLGYGFVMYAAMTLIRGLVMFGVMPLFRKSHYGYSWQVKRPLLCRRRPHHPSLTTATRGRMLW